MKKNINKLVALGIGLSVMSSNIVPVLASEIVKTQVTTTVTSNVESEVKVFNLEDAINAGISHDDQIKIYSSQVNHYKALEDYYDEIDDDSGEDENDININSAKQSKQFRVDGVEYEITNLYNSILLAQKQVEQQEAVVSNKTIETENFKLQAKHGLVTGIDVETQEQALQKEKDTLQDDKNKLNDLKGKLTLATGVDASKRSFNDTINFKPFRVNENLDDYIDDKVNIITKYSEELVDLYRDQEDDMKDDDYDDLDSLLPDKDESKYKSTEDPDTGEVKAPEADYKSDYSEALGNYQKYLGIKMGSETKAAQLSIQEKEYKNKLRSTYTDILSMEAQINQMIAQINTTNKTLANTKLQYELGLMTTNDYNKAVSGYRELDIALRQQLNGYYQLVTAFEKPWSANSGASSQGQ